MSTRGELRVSVAALAVAVVALATHALALGNGFAYDDIPILLGDPRLQSLDLRGILTRGYWQNAELALYRPVTTLSFALDWALAPGVPAWFHLVNVLLHAGVSVLAFLLLARLFPVLPALFGALLFAVHPVHVEAVANVVGRGELLAAAFGFAACLVWDGESRFRTPGVAGLFALALFSKESAIMLPALLALLDLARGGRFERGIPGWTRRNARPLSALVVVAGAWLVVRTAVLGGLAPGRVDPVLEVARSAGARVFTALQAWPEFARLLLFPATLAADYGPGSLLPVQGPSPAALAGAALVALTIGGGGVALALRAPRAAFGLLWFPVTMLPVSNLLFPIGVLVAERTLYLPSFAVSIAAAGAIAQGVRLPAGLRRAPALVATGLLVLAGGRAMVRTPEWRSTETIVAALGRDRPDSFRAAWYGARFARARGDQAAAAAGYDRAIGIWPHRQALVVEAAAWALEQGDGVRAEALARLLIRQWSGEAVGYRLLAGIALDAGDRETARRTISDGLRVAPRDEVLLRMDAALDSAQASHP